MSGAALPVEGIDAPAGPSGLSGYELIKIKSYQIGPNALFYKKETGALEPFLHDESQGNEVVLCP